MITPKTRIIDPQGRIVLPSHIRTALNLQPGNLVTIEVEGDSVRIKPADERCAVCGGSPEGPCAELGSGANRKLICYKCAQTIAQKMIQQM